MGGDAQTLTQVLSAVEGIESFEVSETREDGSTDAVITAQKGSDVKASLSKALAENGCYVLRLEESKASLEDVFMELISEAPAEAAAQTPQAQEPLEVDAQALLDGTMPSAYDAHAAFDAPENHEEGEEQDDDGDL